MLHNQGFFCPIGRECRWGYYLCGLIRSSQWQEQRGKFRASVRACRHHYSFCGPWELRPVATSSCRGGLGSIVSAGHLLPKEKGRRDFRGKSATVSLALYFQCPPPRCHYLVFLQSGTVVNLWNSSNQFFIVYFLWNFTLPPFFHTV